jgi:hypothetical protein
MKKEIVYVLKKVKDDMTSNDGSFKYPKRGWVEAKDWNENNTCGNGRHGLEWGSGGFDIEEYGDLFVVIKVDKADGYVGLVDKVKFRGGFVVLVSKSSKEAIDYIKKFAPKGVKFNYDNSSDDVVSQGYWSTANQRYQSTANQRYQSTANQGDQSTANQGDQSTANQGYQSTANQGDQSTANQGYQSTANQGDWSTANQRSLSTANQGDWSTANQGDRSTATIYGDEAIYRNRGNLSAVIMFYDNDMVVFKHGKDYQTNETVLIREMKIIKRYSGTPEKISSLEDHEIFVFGSNLNGNHAGGAAKTAKEKFGAEEGTGEGLIGQSYAFPTLGKNMKKLKKWRLKEAVDTLIKCACENTTKVFLVTKVGCGIAGHEEEEMKKLFDLPKLPANIVLPKEWY